jgi:hypothetical protein
MRNRILAGIAAIALALGLGAIVTASFERPRPSYGLNVVDDGYESALGDGVVQPYEIKTVAQ